MADATAAAAAAAPEKGVVRVSSLRGHFVSVEEIVEQLRGGEATVTVSALGHAIPDAVAVVESMKESGLVKVTSIKTLRDPAVRRATDKIEIVVVKGDKWATALPAHDARREEIKAKREARKAAKTAEATA